jgi:hypothetical protein
MKLPIFLYHYSCQCPHDSYLPSSSETYYFTVLVLLEYNILVQSVRGACLLMNLEVLYRNYLILGTPVSKAPGKHWLRIFFINK